LKDIALISIALFGFGEVKTFSGRVTFKCWRVHCPFLLIKTPPSHEKSENIKYRIQKKDL